MNVKEFADKHLKPYIIRGKEIVPLTCPFCRSKDPYTFNLNIDNERFQCFRGTCAKKGVLSDLIEQFETQKEYSKPTTKLIPIEETAINYLKSRGFSEETIKYRKLMQNEKGQIAFIYYEGNDPVLVKFREPRKIEKGEKRMTADPGGKPIFWGMETIKHFDSLIITEGEFDQMALTEVGAKSVVSVPFGTNSGVKTVELCWDWIQKFKKVVIFGDNDDAGKDMVKKLTEKIGESKVLVVQEYLNCKDANEILYRHGKDALIKCLNSAKEVPIAGLIRLADVKHIDYTNIERIRTGHQELDSILGGMWMGELTVFTGDNGSGKTTFVNQLNINAINEGYSTCTYSGELANTLLQYWTNLQVAGKENIKMKFDKVRQKDIPYVEDDVREKIMNWYKEKFYIYDSYVGSEMKHIMNVFEQAYRRYNCKMFVVDNLMTVRFELSKDLNQAQSSFINRLKEFAKNHMVTIFLVAHPKKIEGEISKNDIKGTGDITNLADNVISLKRLLDVEEKVKYNNSDSLLTILKNRMDGVVDYKIPFFFDSVGRRFSTDGKNKQFGWR